MKKAQSNFMVLIMVTIILAMVAISVVWGLIRSQQDTTAITVDQFTASNGTCTRVTGDCITPGSTTTILNATGIDATNIIGNFTECGAGGLIYGYDMVAGSQIGIVGITANATYTEQACGRITGFTGTIINYIPLLMAVLILVFVAGYAIK